MNPLDTIAEEPQRVKSSRQRHTFSTQSEFRGRSVTLSQEKPQIAPQEILKDSFSRNQQSLKKMKRTSTEASYSKPYRHSASLNPSVPPPDKRLKRASADSIVKSPFSEDEVHLTRKLKVIYNDLIGQMPSSLEFENSVNEILLSALKLQIYYIYDEKGRIIDLKELNRLAEIKFKHPLQFQKNLPFCPFVNEKGVFENELLYKNYLSHLTLPPNLKASLNEKICLSLFQRLYPQELEMEFQDRTDISHLPTFPPDLFAMIYKNFVPNLTFFSLVNHALKFPLEYMPLFQKTRLLNCVLFIIKSYTHRNDLLNSIKIRQNIRQMCREGKDLNNPKIEHLCREILKTLTELSPIVSKTGGALDLSDYFNKLTNGITEIKETKNTLSLIAEDIKIIACESYCKSTFEELCSEKEEEQPPAFLIHYTTLTTFISSLFAKANPDSLSTEQQLEHRPTRNKVKKILRFSIHLIAALVARKDFFSSITLFIYINGKDISPLFKTDKPKFLKAPSLQSSHSPFSLDETTWNLWQELNGIFSPDDKFKALSTEIEKSQKAGQFFIPDIFSVKRGLIQMKAFMDLRKDRQFLDLNQLRDEGTYLLNLEFTMKTMLNHYQRGNPLKTNMKEILFSKI